MFRGINVVLGAAGRPTAAVARPRRRVAVVVAEAARAAAARPAAARQSTTATGGLTAATRLRVRTQTPREPESAYHRRIRAPSTGV